MKREPWPGGFDPDWTVCPGESISDFMELANLAKDDVSRMLGITNDEFNQLLIGEYPITVWMTPALVEIFGGSVSFWLNREKNYRRDLKMGRTHNCSNRLLASDVEPVVEIRGLSAFWEARGERPLSAPSSSGGDPLGTPAGDAAPNTTS